MLKSQRPLNERLVNATDIDAPSFYTMDEDTPPVGKDLFVHVLLMDGVTTDVVTDMYTNEHIAGQNGWMGLGTKYSQVLHWAEKPSF
jgi:hypothetical protein